MSPTQNGSRSTPEQEVRLWLLLSDLIALIGASAGAFILRYHTTLAERVPVPPLDFVIDTSLLLGGCALVCLRVMGTGRVRQVWRPFELACSVTLALVAAGALFSGLSLIGARFFHRLFAVYLVVLGVPLVLLGRYLIHRMLVTRFWRGRGLRERRLVFIGESPLTRAILRQIIRNPVLGYRVVETFPAEAAADPAAMRRMIGMLRDKTADEVLFGTAPGSYQDLVELVALFRGTGAEVKRAIDVALSGVLLIVLFPVFAAIALAIKLDSPGPIFFRRRCIGRGGAAFDVLKFRSMVEDAHGILERTPEFLEEYRRSLKVKDDPRITRVGRILRRTSLDELPQLVNVFRGEMSLVGPRMLGDIELEKYGDFRDKVLSIRPGITGLWQVSGRHETTFEQRIALDNDYIDRWSIGLDFVILYKTIPEVLRMRGAQ